MIFLIAYILKVFFLIKKKKNFSAICQIMFWLLQWHAALEEKVTCFVQRSAKAEQMIVEKEVEEDCEKFCGNLKEK